MKTINTYINEGKYGPTGKELKQIENSPEYKKLQEICDKYFQIAKQQNIKGLSKYAETIYVRVPYVSDGETRRLCRHLEYDDKFIQIPGSNIYYVINRDDAFYFDVTYGGKGPNSYVAGETMDDDTHKFSTKKSKWVADLIKELNPETKYTYEDFEAD